MYEVAQLNLKKETIKFICVENSLPMAFIQMRRYKDYKKHPYKWKLTHSDEDGTPMYIKGDKAIVILQY